MDPMDWTYTDNPHSTMPQRLCTVCNLSIAADTESEMKVAVIQHIARMHPEEYEEATGRKPTEERVRQQTYLLREGFDG